MATTTQKTKTVKKAPKAPKAAAPGALEAKVYSAAGKETGTVSLPAALFGLPWNANLVHQVVTSMQSNARRGLAQAKTRAEVRGGGKKPWRQKGTGRARHGSSRSPIWKGGGVTHGPRNEKSYEKKISRSMRAKALLVALSRKWHDGEIVFVDKLSMETPKAATAKHLLANLGSVGFPMRRNNAAVVVIPARHAATLKSFGNFGNIEATDALNLNPVMLLNKKYVIIAEPEAVFAALSDKKATK